MTNYITITTFLTIVRLNSPYYSCLLYTSDAADERSSVDLGGRRIIKKKNHRQMRYTDSYTAMNMWTHSNQR